MFATAVHRLHAVLSYKTFCSKIDHTENAAEGTQYEGINMGRVL